MTEENPIYPLEANDEVNDLLIKQMLASGVGFAAVMTLMYLWKVGKIEPNDWQPIVIGGGYAVEAMRHKINRFIIGTKLPVKR